MPHSTAVLAMRPSRSLMVAMATYRRQKTAMGANATAARMNLFMDSLSSFSAMKR